VQLPQFTVPPQPFEIVPQFAPLGHVVTGVQPQTLAVPPPPQVCGAVQLPQLTVPPQPFGIVPQFRPVRQEVFGMHVALQTPATQIWPVAQTWPQVPQLLPSVAVVAQAPLQQVWPEGHDGPLPQTPAATVHTPATHVCPVVQT